MTGGALVALGGLVLWTTRARTAVDVGRVARGAFVERIEEDGRARVRDRFVLTSPVAGSMERGARRAGDRVAAGDPLVVVRAASAPLRDDRSRAELEARRAAAEAARARAAAAFGAARAERAHAGSDAARVRRLAASGSVPTVEREHAEVALRLSDQEVAAARFALQVAEHEVELARAAVASGRDDAAPGDERLVIRAPIDGVVLRVHRESAGPVAPGEPLLELGDPAALEIVVDVLSTDAVRIEPGAEAEIVGWGGARALGARVRRIEPSATTKISALGVEEQRVDVLLDLVDAPDRYGRLGDGYRVETRIVVQEIDRALLVPASALFRDGGRWRAFEITEGRVHRRDIRVLASDGLTAVVGGGLTEGARVVLQPPASLRDGERVEPR